MHESVSQYIHKWDSLVCVGYDTDRGFHYQWSLLKELPYRCGSPLPMVFVKRVAISMWESNQEPSFSCPRTFHCFVHNGRLYTRTTGSWLISSLKYWNAHRWWNKIWGTTSSLWAQSRPSALHWRGTRHCVVFARKNALRGGWLRIASCRSWAECCKHQRAQSNDPNSFITIRQWFHSN